jgi:hypothetical protein
MNQFVINDSFGIEEADPEAAEFSDSKERSHIINISNFGSWVFSFFFFLQFMYTLSQDIYFLT